MIVALNSKEVLYYRGSILKNYSNSRMVKILSASSKTRKRMLEKIFSHSYFSNKLNNFPGVATKIGEEILKLLVSAIIYALKLKLSSTPVTYYAKTRVGTTIRASSAIYLLF